ncbi:hypothetical protein P7K49_021886 [Saguinus oedipus]|uniref:Uncharacterized protein n=1 Tax=Saguinus oedipus TaxID=9490 RepID=A0ABQ9UVP5_SAGOE|nr:hypothetical protein P7K49_021886 [Saguinus oedipus]
MMSDSEVISRICLESGTEGGQYSLDTTRPLIPDQAPKSTCLGAASEQLLAKGAELLRDGQWK